MLKEMTEHVPFTHAHARRAARELMNRGLTEMGSGDDALQNRIIAFINRIRSARTDYNRCELYHIVIGSTMSQEDATKSFFDFDGKDSIARFVRRGGFE